jgi:hypothetical protein
MADAAAHRTLHEVAMFQSSVNDSIMGFRKYRAQAEKKG